LSQYRVELLSPVTGAFVPDAPRGSTSSTKKGGVDGLEKEYVYASRIVDITTGLRGDEPSPNPFVRPFE
jgi:hypothetical protein